MSHPGVGGVLLAFRGHRAGMLPKVLWYLGQPPRRTTGPSIRMAMSGRPWPRELALGPGSACPTSLVAGHGHPLGFLACLFLTSRVF